MKTLLIIVFSLITIIFTYDRERAVKYAYQYVHGANHKCGSGSFVCAPYAYYGDERCGYQNNGGDDTNFVGQCLYAGNHPKLTRGQCSHARTFCGVEPVTAHISSCLPNEYGWISTCGYLLPPPSNIKPGDIIIYFSEPGCKGKAHSALVTKVEKEDVKVTCHSSEQKDVGYSYLKGSLPYYQWLHFPN